MVNNTYEDIETGTDLDFFQTPELEVPPSQPEAHRATVTAVTSGTINDSWTKITVGLVSRDVPTVDQKFEILLPKGYTDSIGSGKAFDPKTLPANAQKSYSIGVANSDKNATLQELIKLAADAGRNPVELGLSRPTDFESYAEGLGKMLVGLEVIMLLREKGGEPPFNHQLIAKRIVSADSYEKSPKLFKKYQLAWENS
jgi:hypothetical protein